MTISTMEELDALPEGSQVYVGSVNLGGSHMWERVAGGWQRSDGPPGVVPSSLFVGYLSQGIVRQEDPHRRAQVGDLYGPAGRRTSPTLYLITQVGDNDMTQYRSYNRGAFVSEGESLVSTWAPGNRMERHWLIPEGHRTDDLLRDVQTMLHEQVNRAAPVPEQVSTQVTVAVTGDLLVRHHHAVDQDFGTVPFSYTYTYTCLGKPNTCMCSTLDQRKVAAGVPVDTVRFDASASCPYG